MAVLHRQFLDRFLAHLHQFRVADFEISRRPDAFPPMSAGPLAVETCASDAKIARIRASRARSPYRIHTDKPHIEIHTRAGIVRPAYDRRCTALLCSPPAAHPTACRRSAAAS